MTTRGYCNEMYYGKKLSVEEILSSTTVSNDDGVTHQPYGTAKMLRRNKDYETLIQMLNDYCVDEHLDNNNYIPPEMAAAAVEDQKEQEVKANHNDANRNDEQIYSKKESVSIEYDDDQKAQVHDPEVNTDPDPVRDCVAELEKMQRKLNAMKHNVTVIGDSMKSLDAALSPTSNSISSHDRYVLSQ